MHSMFTTGRCWPVLVLVTATACGDARGADAGPPVTFEDHVAVILRKNCAQCHGQSKQEAGLDFTSYASLMKGGSGGEVVVAGRSSASRLHQVITEADPAARMPPTPTPCRLTRSP